MSKKRNILTGAVAAAVAAMSFVLVFIAGPARAAGTDAGPNQRAVSFDDLTVKKAYLLGKEPESKVAKRAGIDDTIVVKVDKPGALSGRVAFPNSTSIALYLDNRPLTGVYAESVDDKSGTLQFRLSRDAGNPENVKEWARLLGNPPLPLPVAERFLERPTAVTIGVKGKSPQASDVTRDRFRIERMSEPLFWLCLVLYIGILVLFGYAWRRTDLLRDFGPEPLDKDKDMKKPYSLARMQMALWTLVIIWSALFIWLITGDHSLVTPNVLGYMGISAGAAGWAMKIDKGKEGGFKKKVDDMKAKLDALRTAIQPVVAPLEETKKRLEEEKKDLVKKRDELAADLGVLLHQKPKDDKAIKAKQDEITSNDNDISEKIVEIEDCVKRLRAANAEKDSLEEDITELTVSQGWFKDLFSDINGNSLHRYQLAAWTLVLALVFVVDVWKNLAMPEFDGTTLALMGFSSGAYLWFKSQPGTE